MQKKTIGTHEVSFTEFRNGVSKDTFGKPYTKLTKDEKRVIDNALTEMTGS